MRGFGASATERRRMTNTGQTTEVLSVSMRKPDQAAIQAMRRMSDLERVMDFSHQGQDRQGGFERQ